MSAHMSSVNCALKKCDGGAALPRGPSSMALLEIGLQQV
jgi:hypothetical protein